MTAFPEAAYDAAGHRRDVAELLYGARQSRPWASAARTLTQQQARDIRRRYRMEPTVTIRQLAADNGVTTAVIYKLLSGETYREVA